MRVDSGAAALGCVFSYASLQQPCSGADVELATGDADELIDTVSHEALGSMFDF